MSNKSAEHCTLLATVIASGKQCLSFETGSGADDPGLGASRTRPVRGFSCLERLSTHKSEGTSYRHWEPSHEEVRIHITL